MELLIYLILFLFVLIISTTTNKLLPFLPLPLVQILLGIGIGLFVPDADFHLNTELFLAMVIGPLLFREAEEADITSILKHWRIVVFLIFPVIFISTLSLGGMAHFLSDGSGRLDNRNFFFQPSWNFPSTFYPWWFCSRFCDGYGQSFLA